MHIGSAYGYIGCSCSSGAYMGVGERCATENWGMLVHVIMGCGCMEWGGGQGSEDSFEKIVGGKGLARVFFYVQAGLQRYSVMWGIG